MYRPPSPATLGQADELEHDDDCHNGPRRGARRHRRTVARVGVAVLSLVAASVLIAAPAGAHCSHMSGDPDMGDWYQPVDWGNPDDVASLYPPPPPPPAPPDDEGGGGGGDPVVPLPPPCEGDGADGCT